MGSASLCFEGCVSPPEVVGFSPWPMAPNPRDTALLGPFEGVVERIAFLGQWHGETGTLLERCRLMMLHVDVESFFLGGCKLQTPFSSIFY